MTAVRARQLLFPILLMFGGACAWAGVPSDQVRQTTDKILAVVQDQALLAPGKAKDRQRKIMDVANERFDWKAMARSAMGLHWRSLTDKQRKEFTALFIRLIEMNYMARVENYSGEKILYKGDTTDGKYGVVNVVIVTRKGTDIPVSYRVIKRGTQWLVYDVAIEGVSLVNNYRSQISAILDRSSYEDLVKQIRAKTEQYESGPRTGQKQ